MAPRTRNTNDVSYHQAQQQEIERHDHDHQLQNRAIHSEQQSQPPGDFIPANSTTTSLPDSTRRQRTIVRRRKPEGNPNLIKAMSLVGLKNIFFRQTVTPVPRRGKANGEFTIHGANYVDWSNESQQPLLRASDSPNQLSAPDNHSPDHNRDSEDVESQQSADSKTLKANARGFRIDARVISDATIGLSDGLTVPFALTAGLSALGNTKVVIYGGFAELIAGAISMGLGGYLGAKSEAASYKAQRDEVQELIATSPQTIISDIVDVFEPYSLPRSTLDDLTLHLASSPRLVDFVMHFQHCSEAPASNRALTSAMTIALGYFFGGLLPLIPYFFVGSNAVYEGLYISIGVMVIALFAFGYVKTCVVVGWDGARNIRGGCYGGVQMVIVGSAAAGAAMGLVKLFSDGGEV